MSNELQQQEQQEQDLTFSLNGNEYKYSDCTDEQKELVHQLKDIQAQLERIEFSHRQVSGSKQFFTDELIKSVEGTKPTSEKSAAEEVSS
jgi:hypothetical protein